MKRVWGHVLAGVTLFAGIATTGAVVSACVHDDSSVFVSEMLAPQLVSAGTACVYTADPTQPHITSGVLDVALTTNYVGEFLLGNQVVARGDPTQPQTETSFVKITGAVVTITDSNGVQLASYTQPVSVTIPPSSGGTPGYSGASLPIVDPSTVAKLGLNAGSGTVPIVTFAKFFGATLGGDSVESDNFEFPIEVCYGCLISFSEGDIDPLFVSPNCKGNPNANSSSSAPTTFPCFPGQDDPIDCVDCQDVPACRINENNPVVDGGITDAAGGG